jgi:hypothetical protein
LLGQTPTSQIQFFVTDLGVLRYPTSPWRESDTSDDQVSPLIAAVTLTNISLAVKVINQVVFAGWKIGNGQLIHPTSYAQIKRAQGSWCQSLWDLAILSQALIMALPFAFSPNATINPSTWFVSSAGQTADYLNFINALAFARTTDTFTISCWLATKIISLEKALAKVESYYKPEPNSQWLIDIYSAALAKIWQLEK